MERVRENLARTKLEARVVVEDARVHQDTYDAILLDAPCSATGTIRRHPDLPFIKTLADMRALIPVQTELLDHAWSILRPGGRLVYCTCALLPDEGEAQITAAVSRLGAKVDRDAVTRPGLNPDWISAEGGLRLRPDYWADQGGMDGFYIACLRKDV